VAAVLLGAEVARRALSALAIRHAPMAISQNMPLTVLMYPMQASPGALAWVCRPCTTGRPEPSSTPR
jgi:hypothetical protein